MISIVVDYRWIPARTLSTQRVYPCYGVWQVKNSISTSDSSQVKNHINVWAIYTPSLLRLLWTHGTMNSCIHYTLTILYILYTCICMYMYTHLHFWKERDIGTLYTNLYGITKLIIPLLNVETAKSQIHTYIYTQGKKL